MISLFKIQSTTSGVRRACAGLALLVVLLSPVSPLLAQDSKENADFKLAVSLYNDRMFDLASQQLRQFISAYPASSQAIEARFYLGLVEMQLKQYDEARTAFQNFALSYPDHPRAPEAWLNVGHAFHALGNDREAALAYERVKVFHPDSPLVPEALLLAGQMRRKTGERDAAKQVFRALIQGYPDSKQVVSARLAIGELYAEEGQIELAEEEARRVSRSDAPASVRAGALYAIARFQLGAALFSNAETTLTGIESRYAETDLAPIAAVELGRLEILAGKPKAALTRLQPLAARKGLDDSLRAEALYQLGIAQEALKQYAAAGESWDKLMVSNPAHRLALPARLRAAGAALTDKKYKRALDLCAKMPPDAPPAWRARTMLLSARAAIGLKRPAEAASTLRLFSAQWPADSRLVPALFALAESYRTTLADCKNALRIYEQIGELAPSSPLADDALFASAQCMDSLGDDADAVAAYTDLQSRYPANDRYDEARLAIDRLETHRIRNRDVGMGKLAQLLGGVLSEKPTPMLAYQLGEIYFQDLKDYANAAKQFEIALKEGLGPEETVTASFLRARSYHLLSELEPDAAATAYGLYAKFLEQFPENDWTADAAFFSFQLAAAAGPEGRARKAGEAFLSDHPGSPHAEAVTMELAQMAMTAGRYAEAVTILRPVTEGESPRADEALYETGRAFLAWAEADSSAASKGDSAAAAWRTVVERDASARMTALSLSALAELARSRGDAAESAGRLSTLAQEYPYSGAGEKAARELPGALLQAGSTTEAIAALEGRVPPDSSWKGREPLPGDLGDPADLLTLAQAHDRAGQREESVAAYLRFLTAGGSADPRASEAYFALGNLAKLQGRNGAATAYFREASARGSGAPLSPEIAELLFSSEQYAEAARQFTAIADSSKDAATGRNARSRAIVSTLRLDRTKDADKMIAAFEKKYGKSAPEKADFRYERAMVSFRAKDYAKAKEGFEKVADDDGDTPRGPWAGFYLAKIEELTGDAAKAYEKYREVAKDHPESDVRPRALLSAGNYHFNAERYEEAIGIYQQITADPAGAGDILPFAMTNLIEAYESVKLYENALQMTRDFIQRYPSDPTIVDKKIRIGALYTKIGYYDQAVFQLQALLPEAGAAAEAELRYDIGEAYFYKGEYQQAILEFLKVPYLATGKSSVDWTATSFYMAGQSYEKMMKFDEAIGMYQQVVDRPGIDATFKAAARKEIDRVKLIKNN